MSGPVEPIAHLLGPIEQIPPGEGREFLVRGRAVAVFRLRGGGVAATDARCPHRNGPLADGLVGDGVVVCPLHARRFGLSDGRCTDAADCAVAVHPARVDGDGQIEIIVPHAEEAHA